MSGAAFFDIATMLALVLIGASLALVVIRMILGPTLADRILCLDTITILAAGGIGIYATRTALFLYLDIAIAVALVGFLSTAAFARYLVSRKSGGAQ
jgi:multicomponent Na+:H+ antiporter subunit F